VQVRVDAAPGPQFVVLAALIDPAANIWPPGAVLRDDRAKCGIDRTFRRRGKASGVNLGISVRRYVGCVHPVLMLPTKLHRPFGRWIVAAWTLAIVLGLFGLLRLVFAAAPSDPCPPEEVAACDLTDSRWLMSAAVAIAIALVLAGIAIWLMRRRSRLRFVTPPNWPPSSNGWEPRMGWEPDSSWPAAPEGWEFWQLPR